MASMWKISIGFGALLVALGVGFHVGTDSDSLTSLIPALFGGVIILSGALSMKESIRQSLPDRIDKTEGGRRTTASVRLFMPSLCDS